MTLSNYIDETVQIAQDFLDDDYTSEVGLKKPTELVFNKAIQIFVNASRKIGKKYPNDNKVELNLSENGEMLISWHSMDFEKKYIVRVYETIEDDNRKLKIELTKNITL